MGWVGGFVVERSERWIDGDSRRGAARKKEEIEREREYLGSMGGWKWGEDDKKGTCGDAGRDSIWSKYSNEIHFTTSYGTDARPRSPSVSVSFLFIPSIL